MKHVKIYEDMNKELKLYVVWDNNPNGTNSYEIIQITDKKKDFDNENNFIYFSIPIYKYKDDELTKVKNTIEEFFNGNKSTDYILFTSDYIEDCITYLETMESRKKYNL